MKKLVVIKNTPERTLVAYQDIKNGYVYVLGDRDSGGGHYAVGKDVPVFTPYTWSNDTFKHYPNLYAPLYKGDKIQIIEEIML